MTSLLAVIPAREGSKGILGKNLRPVAGRPLIAWTIQAALDSKVCDRVIVTTDSEEIAAVARREGAEVPFMRPSELARDETPGIDPVVHALEWLDAEQAYRPERFALLQPTSPLRNADDIRAANALAFEKDADAVLSVSLAQEHPAWMQRIDPAGRLKPFHETPTIARRQDLPPAHALNGAIYLAKSAPFLATRSWFTDKTYAYVMPAERSIDIDTPWDLRIAEFMMESRHVG